MTFVEALREQIRDLEIHPVVAGDQEIRLVRDRHHTPKAALLDAVLLDDVWRVLDAAEADHYAAVERAAKAYYMADGDVGEDAWGATPKIVKDEYRKAVGIVVSALVGTHTPTEASHGD